MNIPFWSSDKAYKRTNHPKDTSEQRSGGIYGSLYLLRKEELQRQYI